LSIVGGDLNTVEDGYPDTEGTRRLRAGLAEYRRGLESSGKRVSHLSDAQLSAGVLRERPS
jgi:hypothetical protein